MSEPASSERTGGCLCGNVRYRVTGEPAAARICWCRDCQRLAANGTVNALFPTANIDVSGDVATYSSVADSGNTLQRRFCAHCGSHLFADSSGRPGLTVLRIGTLDDPSSIRPVANIWATSAPAWACFDVTLARFERQPVPNPQAR